VSIDLESDLRRAFARSADSAPDVTPQWPRQSIAVVASPTTWHSTGRTGRHRLVGLSVAALLLIGVVAVVAGHRSVDQSTTFTPPGAEFTLTPIAVVEPTTNSYVRPGSVHSASVPGHPPLTVYIAATAINGHVREYRCLEAVRDGSGCAPQWTWSQPDIGQMSTIANHLGSFDLWTWSNVPAGTSYVVWTYAGQVRWQRPVAGIAAFPVFTDLPVNAGAVAYDAAGVVLARAGAGAEPSTTVTDPDHGLISNLDSVAQAELDQLTRTSLNACLINPTGDWTACVAHADEVVHARFKELGGRLVPTSEATCGDGFVPSSTGGCQASPTPTTAAQTGLLQHKQDTTASHA
jgi:hypothetical protein